MIAAADENCGGVVINQTNVTCPDVLACVQAQPAAAACDKPTTVIGEDALGVLKKFPVSNTDQVKTYPLAGNQTTNGAFATPTAEVTLTLVNPSACHAAEVIAVASYAAQITNGSGSYAFQPELDGGSGTYAGITTLLFPRLNGMPAGYTQTAPISYTTVSTGSITIPAGGTITIRARSNSVVYAASAGSSLDSQSTQLAAMVIVRKQ